MFAFSVCICVGGSFVFFVIIIIIILLSFSHHKSGKNRDSLYSDTLLS